MVYIKKDEVLEQSRRAYSTWATLWRNNCRANSILQRIPLGDIQNKGIGKTAVLVSMGPSLEKNVNVLRDLKNQNKVDILCVDKAMSYLIDNGVKPDLVMIADAQISYENYCEKYIPYSANIMLVANINSNPSWGQNWLGPKSYYVNKDNIQSEKEFSALSGIYDQIPAGSNVSNALGILASMVLNYDKYLLVGYDYAWHDNFYAGDKYHVKNYYLNQMRVPDHDGLLITTSQNLWFSCRWFRDFISAKMGHNRVVNCSDGILSAPMQSKSPPPKLSKLDIELAKIKQYLRPLSAIELDKIQKRKLTVHDEASFEAVKKIINSDSALILKCEIEYRLKEEEGYANGRENKIEVHRERAVDIPKQGHEAVRG